MLINCFFNGFSFLWQVRDAFKEKRIYVHQKAPVPRQTFKERG